MFGKLKVKVRSARLTRDTELFGQMDPYCNLTIGGQKHRTKTHNRGGKKPVWEEEVEFLCKGEEEMLIDCFDEDTYKKDDLVGTGLVHLTKILSNLNFNGKIPIFYKKKSSGEIFMEIQFIPASTETSLMRFAKALASGIWDYRRRHFKAK